MTYDWTFKYTGSVGARIRDPDTIEALLQSGVDYSDVDTFVEENYNGVDHYFIENYYMRFLFDNLLNIVLVMILMNMI